MTSSRPLAAVGASVLLVLVLTGCATGLSGVPESPAPSRAVATPAPTATPALPADALFQISGVATAPNGARVRIVETVSGPSAADGSETATMTAGGCEGSGTTWRYPFPNASWMRTGIASTVMEGPDWPSSAGVVAFGGSGLDVTAWSGDWHGVQSDCAAGEIVIPGHASGLSPVTTTDPRAKTAWTAGRWGFAWSYTGEAPAHPDVTMSDCRLTLSAAAQSDASYLPQLPSPAGWAPECVYGSVS